MVKRQKITRKPENNSQQALQRFKKMPDELGYVIEIVNCLPPDGLKLRFMNPASVRARVKAEVELDRETKGEDPLDIRLDVAACEETRLLPSELQNYVWRGEWKGGSFRVEPIEVHRDILATITGKKPKKPVKLFIPVLPGAFLRYSEVWDAYEKLHGIAKAAKDARQRWNLLRLGRHASIPTAVVIDAKGMVRERKSLFSLAIEGQDIEAARIRECPVCSKIFWAGRITQICCTPKCGNTFRVQRHRYRTDEEKEAYKWRRYQREMKRQKETKKIAESTKKGK
jgi:hypothetical protein